MTTSKLFTAAFWADALERVITAIGASGAALFTADAVLDFADFKHIALTAVLGGGVQAVFAVLAGVRGGDASFRSTE